MLAKRLSSNKVISLHQLLIGKEKQKSLAMDDSSIKAPIQIDSTLIPSFKETMAVQVHIQKEEDLSIG